MNDDSVEVIKAINSWKRSLASVDSDYAFETAGWSSPGTNIRLKCLPYYDFNSLRELQEIGCYLYENCPTIRSAISKMVSYVVSSGHRYNVSRRRVPKKFARGVSVSESVVDEISAIVDYTMDNCYPGGWRSLQEESIVRLYREGEYFRRIFQSGQDVQVRFIEPYSIKSPQSIDENETLGVQTAPGDAVTVTGYWHYNCDGADCKSTFIPSNEVQHAKQGVDANDPRGVPVLWTTFCQSARIKNVNEAMCKLAITQAAYAVVRQYDSTITFERMKSIAKGFSDARSESGDPTPGSEVEAKGFTFEFPSMDVDARSFVEIIHQQQRDVAGVLDMPEFMLSADASSGNRASLVSAEGPFDRRVQREQSKLGYLDVDILWRSVQAYQGWTDDRLAKVKRVVHIEPKYPRPASRDQHKDSSPSKPLLPSSEEIISLHKKKDGFTQSQSWRWLEHQMSDGKIVYVLMIDGDEESLDN